MREENKREDGFSNVEISPNWLISENLKVQKTAYDGEFFVQTSQNIFEFSFNSYGNGLNGVRKSNYFTDCNKCPSDLEFRKISLEEVKFNNPNSDSVPYTNLCYYFVEGRNIIKFRNRDPIQVQVWYVPVVIETDEQCNLNDALIDPITERVLNLFIASKNGIVIQKTDDGNRNLEKATQTNPALSKN
jgi:hypothetical protein